MCVCKMYVCFTVVYETCQDSERLAASTTHTADFTFDLLLISDCGNVGSLLA